MKLMLVSLILAVIVISAFLVISKPWNKMKEKMTPFECGFDAFSTGRIPFSLRFFKITLIFLIFDIEIIAILPIPMMMNLSSQFLTSFVILMTIITLGLFYEWKVGSLNWVK